MNYRESTNLWGKPPKEKEVWGPYIEYLNRKYWYGHWFWNWLWDSYKLCQTLQEAFLKEKKLANDSITSNKIKSIPRNKTLTN